MDKLEPAVSPPLRLSVSKSKCWSHCRKQYEYTYIIKLDRKERDFHIFGSFIHKVLEEFHRAYINGSTLPLNEQMQIAFKVAKVEFATKITPAQLQEAHTILCQYLQHISSDPYDRIHNVLAAEEAFSFQLTDNITLNGFIDKIEIDQDGLTHISDYKSTKQKKYLKDDWFQLLTYAYVVMHNKPELDKVRVSYVLLRHNFEPISKVITRGEAETVKQIYIDYWRDIESATEYPATVSQLCRFCDHIDVCAPGLASIGKETRHGEIEW